MGALIVPTNGVVYIDANAAIYAVERIEPYASLLYPLWLEASAGRVTVVTSELTWLETLTKPIRDGNAALELLFRSFLTSRELQLVPATLDTWERAARIRSVGLKTPDALHAATAIGVQCDQFLTNDAAFARVQGLPVTILSTLAASAS